LSQILSRCRASFKNGVGCQSKEGALKRFSLYVAVKRNLAFWCCMTPPQLHRYMTCRRSFFSLLKWESGLHLRRLILRKFSSVLICIRCLYLCPQFSGVFAGLIRRNPSLASTTLELFLLFFFHPLFKRIFSALSEPINWCPSLLYVATGPWDPVGFGFSLFQSG